MDYLGNTLSVIPEQKFGSPTTDVWRGYLGRDEPTPQADETLVVLRNYGVVAAQASTC